MGKIRSKFIIGFYVAAMCLSAVALPTSPVRQTEEPSDAEAQYKLGLRYYKGEGVAKQPVEAAVKWYRKAADQGYVKAQDNLGLCYHLGEGVAKDAVEAAKWYRKAADQGYALAQVSLGNSYCDGNGVEKDYVEAVNIWEGSRNRAILAICY
jgi:TPR repeat protein